MKKLSLILVLVSCLVLVAGGAFGASDTKNLTVNANVGATAKLTISPSSITFPDTDPDTTPIPANSTVSVSAKARTGSSSNITLTHKAAADLSDGTHTIAINNVSWTASGTNYVGGTMNTTTEQNVGAWTGGGTYDGILTYSMVNSWSYQPGAYTATTTFTLTVP
jgi:hypothetical protein